MGRIVVVSGASSGIGAAVARAFLEQGDTVIGLSRRPTAPAGAHAISCDLVDETVRSTALALIAEEHGRIDVLVNCAGAGIAGSIEDTSATSARQQLEVNVIAVVELTRAALPLLRCSEAPRVVNVGSVAGLLPIPFQAWYSASKAALGALSWALAEELRPEGIGVCVVLPGDTRTGFTGARMTAAPSDRYRARVGRSVGRMERDERAGADPASIASVVVREADRRTPRVQRVVGTSYRAIEVVRRILPPSIVNRLIGSRYG